MNLYIYLQGAKHRKAKHSISVSCCLFLGDFVVEWNEMFESNDFDLTEYKTVVMTIHE